MMVGQERVPLLARGEHHAFVYYPVLDGAPQPLSSIRVDARVAGIGEEVVHCPIRCPRPADVTVG